MFFNVLINGRNFLLETEDGIAKHGFYVTVYVEAENQDEAELKAVQFLKSDEKLRAVLKNDKQDPPMLYANEFAEFEKKPKEHTKKLGRNGMAWYPEGEEEA